MASASESPRRRWVARARAALPSERTEWVLGAFAVALLALILALLGFVFANAWPSFANNGLGWFGDGDGRLNVNQQIDDVYNKGVYTLGAWPLLFGTLLTTGIAVVVGLAFALLGAVFMVEFAPPLVSGVLRRAVRLLAAVPSVIFGLIGVLALAPLVDRHLVSESFKLEVGAVVPISGTGLLLASVILSFMITPIMLALIADALESVPPSWREGSAALGVNRWRTMWRVTVRAARPAIVAAVVLATARALGEAIMLAMVSGSFGFAPNPLDGLNFFLEPILPLGAAIANNAAGITSGESFPATIYAFAAVLLASAALLSVAGFLVKLPMRRYGIR